jgi:hypothetical protein
MNILHNDYCVTYNNGLLKDTSLWKWYNSRGINIVDWQADDPDNGPYRFRLSTCPMHPNSEEQDLRLYLTHLTLDGFGKERPRDVLDKFLQCEGIFKPSSPQFARFDCTHPICAERHHNFHDVCAVLHSEPGVHRAHDHTYEVDYFDTSDALRQVRTVLMDEFEEPTTYYESMSEGWSDPPAPRKPVEKATSGGDKPDKQDATNLSEVEERLAERGVKVKSKYLTRQSGDWHCTLDSCPFCLDKFPGKVESPFMYINPDGMHIGGFRCPHCGDSSNSKRLETLLGLREEPKVKAGEPEMRKIVFMEDEEFLAQFGAKAAYVIDGLVAQGDCTILSGPPKVGKSTTYREMMRCVYHGEPFLGRDVKKGELLYFPLEENLSDVFHHLKLLEVPISIIPFIENGSTITLEDGSKIPDRRLADKFEDLAQLARERHPALIVIDSMVQMVDFAGRMNDYDVVSEILTPYVRLAQELNVAILFVHHDGKGSDRGITERAIGSTAITKMMHTIISMRRDEGGGHRYIEATGRTGFGIPKTVLTFDQSTGRVSAEGSPQEVADKDAVGKYREAIMQAFTSQYEETEEGLLWKELLNCVPGEQVEVKRAIYKMKHEGEIVIVSGEGKRGKPQVLGLKQHFPTV